MSVFDAYPDSLKDEKKKEETLVGIKDVKFIAFINFLLAVLWFETSFFPLDPWWARYTVPGLAVFWNVMNNLVWLRKPEVLREKQ